MKPADRNLILEKLVSLNQYSTELESNLQIPLKRFLAEQVRQRAVERLFQIVVECATDTNTLLLVAMNQTPANSARESYQAIGELGGLDNAMTKRFREQYVPKRNFIVHLYEKVEPRDLYYSAHRLVRDVREYAEQIQHFVDARASNNKRSRR
ncbi:MAG: DUF86 domain-containing protein [Chloroflexota bacterium]|nr:DUF86 domain-containing protein [Chloroflexota bacterium]